MGEYICERKCYFKDRIWNIGEVLVANENEPPKHFIDKKLVGDPRKRKKQQDKPMSYAELTRNEALSTIKSLKGKVSESDIFN